MLFVFPSVSFSSELKWTTHEMVNLARRLNLETAVLSDRRWSPRKNDTSLRIMETKHLRSCSLRTPFWRPKVRSTVTHGLEKEKRRDNVPMSRQMNYYFFS